MLASSSLTTILIILFQETMKSSLTRRGFLRTAGLAGLIAPASGLLYAPAGDARAAGTAQRREVHIFSKHLQWLDFKHMAEFAAECGFDGVDITVRPGGHVEPSNVARDLPLAVQAVKRTGKKVRMITTAIKGAGEPHTRSVLATAGKLQVEYYRLGWYDYVPATGVEENLKQTSEKLRSLIELSRQNKVKGAYQNHAGLSVGAPVWDIARILRELNSPWMGAQYDIRHATLEGGTSWPLGFEYIRPYINSLDIKDFLWIEKDGNWEAQNVPLGKGMVDFAKFFGLIRTLPAEIPLCLHVEYPIGGAEHGGKSVTISAREIMKTMKEDLDFVRKML